MIVWLHDIVNCLICQFSAADRLGKQDGVLEFVRRIWFVADKIKADDTRIVNVNAKCN